jgi:hypothetical protein
MVKTYIFSEYRNEKETRKKCTSAMRRVRKSYDVTETHFEVKELSITKIIFTVIVSCANCMDLRLTVSKSNIFFRISAMQVSPPLTQSWKRIFLSSFSSS